ncbi:MAG: hypothetical protein KAH25_06600 [Bacteroidales bacterium]|nr:hypothetical protein [Bacteroidales bacterium]
MSKPLNYYKDKEQAYSALLDKYTSLNKKVAILRLIWFLLWALAIWASTYDDVYTVVLTVFIGLIVFVALVVYHNKINAKKLIYQLFKDVNLREINVLNNKYNDLDDGAEFIDEAHFYSHDLDVFGPFSLFQYINRAFSQKGKIFLAERFSNRFKNKTQIEAQQKAISDLSLKPDWMQDFLVLGQLTQLKQHKKTSPIDSLSNWAKREGHFSNSIFKIAVVVISIMSWLVLYLLINDAIKPENFLLYLIVPLGFAGLNASRINKNHQELGKQSATLSRWKDVFKHFEQTPFDAEVLKDLKANLLADKDMASGAIKKLAALSQAFDTRLNLFGWFVLNYLFAWDVLQSIRLELWRKKYGKSVGLWFQTLAELEGLVSLAVFKHNQAAMIFPQIANDGFVYNAKEAAHPLIPVEARVGNTIDFDGLGHFTIVTGANMAGKSTYLRTVGANMILALCGSAVCAKELTISPIQLFTSIRTKDNLAKNESYFYAELLRLQAIIEELKNGQPLFIILDEILKGTNSKDKEMGSKALVKQLIGLNATGIIATHDLQLGSLISEFPEHVKNRCFEVDIHDDKLDFDYTLREGVSQNLNATFLMNKMGITVKQASSLRKTTS